jgi:hypothetical protein
MARYPGTLESITNQHYAISPERRSHIQGKRQGIIVLLVKVDVTRN